MAYRIVVRIYAFSIEFFLGLLFSFFYYIGRQTAPPILQLFLLCVGAFFLLSFLLEVFLGKGKWLYLIFGMPFLFVLGLYVGLPLFLNILFALFVFWRGLSLYDLSQQHENFSLLFTFLIGIFVLFDSSIKQYPFQNVIGNILLLEFLLIFIFQFIKKWLLLQDGKYGFAVFFVKATFILSLFAVLLSFFEKYIGLLFSGILRCVAIIFSILGIPIYYLVKQLSLKKFSSNPNENENVNDLLKAAEKAKNQPYHLTNEIMSLFVIVIVILCFFFLIKRIKANSIKSHIQPNGNIQPFALVMESGSLHPKNKQKPPNELIRKEIFKFEKYAQKHQFGRLPFETLQEWFKRIGLIETEQVVTLYEQTRYGELSLAEQEQILFKDKIRILKQQLQIIKNKD